MARSPDATKLILRVSVGTEVFAYPQGTRLTTFEQYGNRNWIAMAGDRLAVAGPQVHVFDLAALRHVTTLEPPTSPWCGCFTPDGRLLTGHDAADLLIWDPATGTEFAKHDAAPDRSRKPALTALAASGHHLAAARRDGTVVLFDRHGTLVRMFDKHDVTQPDTGATALSGIAFSPDGTHLWVSAGPAQGPVGLTVYTL